MSTQFSRHVAASIKLLKMTNVDPHPDGRYHVHVATTHQLAIFDDPALVARLMPADDAPLPDLLIGAIDGCYLYRNNYTEQSFITGADGRAIMVGTR